MDPVRADKRIEPLPRQAKLSLAKLSRAKVSRASIKRAARTARKVTTK
jgi:hypothetical protein|tara:strand:- start:190 stop:333 length:144 start_codon:yes stop_codon:yes gene_type:complete